MHHGDTHTLLYQTIGRFKTQQSATNHHGMFVFFGCVQHLIHVVNITEAHDTFQVMARHGNNERIGTGCDQQAIIFFSCAIRRNHLSTNTIDLGNFLAFVQGNAIVHIPLLIIEHDLINGLVSSQYRREHNTVVVTIRFCAEHGNFISIGRDLEQFLDGTDTCHAISDNNQFFLHFHISKNRL